MMALKDHEEEQIPLISERLEDPGGGRTSRATRRKNERQGGPTSVRSFDDGNWLTRMRGAEYRNKFLRSSWMFWGMVVTGIVVGQIGPAFLDLQIITHTSIQQASGFLTVTPAGDIIGSFVSGFIYDHISKTLLPVACLQMMGMTLLAIPFCSWYWCMVTACFILFFCRAAVILVAMVDTLRIWGAHETAFLQALCFGFSFGAVVAPIITEPFLAAGNQTAPNNHSNCSTTQGHSHVNVSKLTLVGSDFDLATNPTPHEAATEPNGDTEIRFAFFISSALCFFVSLPLLLEYFKDRFGKTKQTSINPELVNDVEKMKHSGCVARSDTNTGDQHGCQGTVIVERKKTITVFSNCEEQRSPPPLAEESSSSSGVLNLPLVPYIAVVIWRLLLYFIDLGTQLMSWSYLTTFAVLQMNWSKSQAAFLSSAFWVSMTAGRFICFFLPRRLTSLQILAISIGLCTPSVMGLILASLNQLDWGVWLCTLFCGMSMAPIYANSLAWINSSLITITGKLNSLIDVFCGLGLMSTFAAHGALMGNGRPMWFAYIMLGKAILTFLVFLSLHLFSRHYLLPKYGTK